MKKLVFCSMAIAVTLLTVAVMQYTILTDVDASILTGPNDNILTEPSGLSSNTTSNNISISEGIQPVRMTDHNVVTWDSRGKGQSGGTLELGR
jgi:hypothetical protein